MNPLASWILTILLSLTPTQKLTYVGAYNEAEGERKARLESYAADLANTVTSYAPVFRGDDGVAKSAVLLLAIAKHESNFSAEVDLGLNRAKRTKAGQEDHGRSWCTLQINLGQRGKMLVGDAEMRSWSGRDLLRDRTKCFRAGLEIARRSVASCTSVFPGDTSRWLNQYASGECLPPTDVCEGNSLCLVRATNKLRDASKKSKDRVRTYEHLWQRFGSQAPKVEQTPQPEAARATGIEPAI